MSLKKLRVFPILGMMVVGIMIGVWVFISGCGKEEVTTIPDPPAPKAPTLKFESWEKPAAALILTGEIHGYIEPCGCSETQSGGFARRADLVRRLNERGWSVAGLDLGGSLRLAKTTAGAELRSSQLVNDEQSKIKFDTQLKAMEQLRYAGMTLGFEELALGVGYLVGEKGNHLNPQGAKARPVFMGANLGIYRSPDLGPVQTQTIILGDVKIGVTSFLGDSIRRKLYGDNPDGEELQFQKAVDVLPGMLEKLAAENTDFNILLAQAPFDETQQVLEKVPGFAFAVCQSGEEGRDDPEIVGETHVLQVGQKGKKVGLLAYYPNKKPSFQFELVELDNLNFKNDESIEPLLIEYQEKLKENQGAIFGTMTKAIHPGGEFAGAHTCGECHKKAYQKWKTSKHAHAYETLKTGRKGQYSQPISRIHDPECLTCHVTGWDPQGVFPYQSGFLPEALAPEGSGVFEHLQGQQCENCHGPGADHVQLEKDYQKDSSGIDRETMNAARRKMQLRFSTAKDAVCRKCHDLENSPKFDQNADEYWEKIKHPWRD